MIFSLTDPTPLPSWLIASLLRDVISRLLGALGFGNPSHRRAMLLAPFAAYAGRVLARFERLLARHRAGSFRLAAPRPDHARKPEAARKTPRLRLPRQWAWVIDVVGYRAAGMAENLQYLLSRPDAAGLLALYPQAQSMLRPLGHMLGIAPAGIPPLKRRPRKPRPQPQHPRRLTRKEREAILWYPNSEGKPMKLLPRRLPRD
ncbi:MAG: hypothetical protein NT133_12615 [Alphaproteobacteria bacterium]|nr:hypothetical protein [Alphaproteobacteria bacterium]